MKSWRLGLSRDRSRNSSFITVLNRREAANVAHFEGLCGTRHQFAGKLKAVTECLDTELVTAALA